MLRRDNLCLIGEDGETRHPDDIDEALADLIEHARPPELPSPSWEATWHLRIWYDPEERRTARRRQKSQLGRYMHQGVLQWGNVDLEVFEGHYGDLCEMLAGEGPLESEVETQM